MFLITFQSYTMMCYMYQGVKYEAVLFYFQNLHRRRHCHRLCCDVQEPLPSQQLSVGTYTVGLLFLVRLARGVRVLCIGCARHIYGPPKHWDSVLRRKTVRRQGATWQPDTDSGEFERLQRRESKRRLVSLIKMHDQDPFFRLACEQLQWICETLLIQWYRLFI